MDRGEVLDTAKQLVTQDRAQEHGDVTGTFSLIARLWSEYLDHEVSPGDVAMLMSLLKIARQRGNPGNIDSYIDLAGYASLAAELLTPPDQRDAKLDEALQAVVEQPPTHAPPSEASQWQRNTPGGFL